jgi:hypothetical protein
VAGDAWPISLTGPTLKIDDAYRIPDTDSPFRRARGGRIP